MKPLVLLALFSMSMSCGVRTYECTKGAEGIDTAVAFMAEFVPDVVDNLQVFCDDERALASITRCGRAKAKHIESCLMWIGGGPYAARIYVSHDEDAAKSVCHELEHAVPAAWTSEDGCQSHLQSCGFSTAQMQACQAAVDEFRLSLRRAPAGSP